MSELTEEDGHDGEVKGNGAVVDAHEEEDEEEEEEEVEEVEERWPEKVESHPHLLKRYVLDV